MASFPTSNPSDSTLWVATNFLSTSLDGAHDNSTNIITVLDASSFPSSGYVVVDTEVIKYTSTTGTTFKNCTRGADGSSAASHSDGTTVYQNWVADHHNVLKDEIIAIATNLTNRIGGHATQIQFPDGSVTNPSASFANDTGAGQYWIANDNIGYAINGVKITEWKSTGFGIPDGSVTNPGLFFSDNTDMGLYRSSDVMYAIIDGTAACAFTPAQIQARVNLNPLGTKTLDQGATGTSSWDDCYADDWHNEADVPFFDSIIDTKGNKITIDDIEIIKNIKPARDNEGGLVYSDEGFSVWDDNSLPEWIFSKIKNQDTRTKDVTKIGRTPEGKPYISSKALGGLALGGIRKLIERLEKLESEVKTFGIR